MTNKDKTATQIRSFIFEHFPLARQQSLADDDSLLEGGIVDSMGILELVAFLEQEFNMTFSDDELVPEHFESILALVDFVDDKVGTTVSQKA